MKLDLNQALEQLAQAFNTTVDKLYPMMIKQAYISGATAILVFLISMTVAFILFKLNMKSKKNYTKKDSWSSSWQWSEEGIPFIFAWVFTAIFIAIALIIMLVEAPTALLNPEYWALKEILRSIK